MSTALIIAGHGSHLSPYTAAPAWRHADTIRALGVFDEVTCAFWKEMPSLHRVMATLTADDITIVPLFTSLGYFSRTVLPTEFGLDGPLTLRDGRIIRYTDTVGQHPTMTNVVRARSETVLTQYDLDPSHTALALVGHGTRRDRESAVATQRQADVMRTEGRFAEVVALYLDEPPQIEKLYEVTSSPSIIVVPFFVAGGSHTQEDIPRALQLSPDPRRLGYPVPAPVDGRAVYYTPAVGMEASLSNVILDLCRAAGTPLPPDLGNHDVKPLPTDSPSLVEVSEAAGAPVGSKIDRANRLSSDPTGRGEVWAGFPKAGLDALRATQFPLNFGQLLVEAQGNDFTIHHINDAAPSQRINNPAALRERLSLNATGSFRALRTGVDLPHGWCVQVNSFEALLAVLETIYPTAWIDYVQQQNQSLPIQTMEQVAARQTGIYRLVAKLSSERLPGTVAAHCGSCIRYPTWFYAGSPSLFAVSEAAGAPVGSKIDRANRLSSDPTGRGEVALPCPEPCQCWMSFALQQVEADREAKLSLDFSPAELQSLRAALRTAIVRPEDDIRPAEYEDPLNPARLRALLARLNEAANEKRDS